MEFYEFVSSIFEASTREVLVIAGIFSKSNRSLVNEEGGSPIYPALREIDIVEERKWMQRLIEMGTGSRYYGLGRN